MSRFQNRRTGVTVSVDDSKDGRFGEGWERADQPAKQQKAPAKPKSEK